MLFKGKSKTKSVSDLSARKTLIKISGLKRGRVLDIGLGDCGCMSLFLAKKGFDVIGIDTSTKAIHVLRKQTAKRKFKRNFAAKVANVEKLPFKDNEFDAVFAYHSMHHVHNIKTAINEMFRVCRKNGLILISDLNDTGRKAYEHEPDNGKLLKTVENILLEHTKSIKKKLTKYNKMFICKKKNM